MILDTSITLEITEIRFNSRTGHQSTSSEIAQMRGFGAFCFAKKQAWDLHFLHAPCLVFT